MRLARFWSPPTRDTHKLIVRQNFAASKWTLYLIHRHFGRYMFPITAANDRDHCSW